MREPAYSIYRIGNIDCTIIAQASDRNVSAMRNAWHRPCPLERRCQPRSESAIRVYFECSPALDVSLHASESRPQKPKLSPHKETIRGNLCALLDCHPSCVNLKAKTHEKVDSLGENRSIAAEVKAACRGMAMHGGRERRDGVRCACLSAGLS